MPGLLVDVDCLHLHLVFSCRSNIQTFMTTFLQVLLLHHLQLSWAARTFTVRNSSKCYNEQTNSSVAYQGRCYMYLMYYTKHRYGDGPVLLFLPAFTIEEIWLLEEKQSIPIDIAMFRVMSPFVINVPTRTLLFPYTKRSFQIMVGTLA